VLQSRIRVLRWLMHDGRRDGAVEALGLIGSNTYFRFVPGNRFQPKPRPRSTQAAAPKPKPQGGLGGLERDEITFGRILRFRSSLSTRLPRLF
jgi:hypothetical protein